MSLQLKLEEAVSRKNYLITNNLVKRINVNEFNMVKELTNEIKWLNIINNDIYLLNNTVNY